MALSEDRIITFCEVLLETNSQRQAYRAAYPSSQKWKDSSVDSKASHFIDDARVQAKLDELRKKAAEKSQIKRQDILDHLKVIGFANINPEHIRASDKIKALELMAKMLGFDKDDNSDSLSRLDEVLGKIEGSI